MLSEQWWMCFYYLICIHCKLSFTWQQNGNSKAWSQQAKYSLISSFTKTNLLEEKSSPAWWYLCQTEKWQASKCAITSDPQYLKRLQEDEEQTNYVTPNIKGLWSEQCINQSKVYNRQMFKVKSENYCSGSLEDQKNIILLYERISECTFEMDLLKIKCQCQFCQ